MKATEFLATRSGHALLGALAVIVIATVAGTLFGTAAMRWLMGGAAIFGVTASEAFTKPKSWECGDPANPGGAASVKARLNAGTLTVSGAGKMAKGFNWTARDESISLVVIGDSVTSVEDDAFKYCKTLKSAVIGNGVTYIGEKAFFRCDSLMSVTIGNGVTTIRAWAFSSSGLKSITLGNGLTYIGDAAFQDVGGITSITIPNSVTYIGMRAFSWCKNLASVIVPAGVSFIGTGAFSGDSLTSIDVAPENADYASVDGVLFNKGKTTLIQYPNGKEGPYDIPVGVDSIGETAFLGCDGLTSITFPGSVVSIGDMAFLACSKLTSVIIGNGVVFIGESAFQSCAALSSVTIPAGVAFIGMNAFCSCKKLLSVTSLRAAPPTIGFNRWDSTYSAFRDGDKAVSACLYVPPRGVDAYKAAKGWGSDRFPFTCIKPANTI